MFGVNASFGIIFSTLVRVAVRLAGRVCICYACCSTLPACEEPRQDLQGSMDAGFGKSWCCRTAWPGKTREFQNIHICIYIYIYIYMMYTWHLPETSPTPTFLGQASRGMGARQLSFRPVEIWGGADAAMLVNHRKTTGKWWEKTTLENGDWMA